MKDIPERPGDLTLRGIEFEDLLLREESGGGGNNYQQKLRDSIGHSFLSGRKETPPETENGVNTEGK